MIDKNQLQLKHSSILKVPLQTYDLDFSFIVNGEEFKTSRLVSELLSPNICKMHLSDPTINQFVINTQENGDFSHILQLINFNKLDIQTSEIGFISEVIEILGNENLEITEADTPTEITISNVFPLIKKHEKYSKFSEKNFNEEIEFVSSHFYEICESYGEDLKSLKETTLQRILGSQNLCLNNEDQLLNFIDQIYIQNENFAVLFEKVIFANVTSESIKEFIQIFDFNDLTASIWSSLSKRLELKTENKIESENGRYKIESTQNQIQNDSNVIKNFVHDENNELNGIIRYLTNKVGQNIHDNGLIEITSKSHFGDHHQKNLVDLDQNNCYWTEHAEKDAWICFDFKKMKIEFTGYTIETDDRSPGSCHIKNWVFEVSDDGKNWSIIDEHSNYDGLNGNYFIKTFNVKPNNFSQFCRIRCTGEYYDYPRVFLVIKSVEFYGKLKEV